MPPSSPRCARPLGSRQGAPGSRAPGGGGAGQTIGATGLPRGSGGACLCPHLLSVMSPPPPASPFSASVSPTRLSEAQGLRLCASPSFCVPLCRPLSLCVGFFWVARAWGSSAGLWRSQHRRGRSSACSQLGAPRPLEALNPLSPWAPGPHGGQQVGCEGTRVALPPPRPWCPPTQSLPSS